MNEPTSNRPHGDYWRAIGYMVTMTYAGIWAYQAVHEYPESKLSIALLFIAAIAALTAVYCVLSRKD